MNPNLRKKLMFASKQILYACIIQAIAFQLLIASPSSGQSMGEVTVSINVQDSRLVDIFAVIKQQTEFVFSYPNQIKEDTAQYTLKYKNVPLIEVLTYLAKEGGYYFRQISNNISVVKYMQPNRETQSQKVLFDRIINGKVTDAESGEPLIGVNIVVENTTLGTATDEFGEFSLNIPDDATTLVVSYLGYVAQHVELSDKISYTIELVPDSEYMEEIVVIGYGEQQKSDITGSVASVSRKRLELVPNRNIAQVLQGALPGIVVQQTTAGAVGEQTILIRGRNSILASNDPLIVVDGIPYYGDLNDININDVQSLEVLKDASAAAIYGSRGSNGVILVTTKTGKKGKARISYQGKFGTQNYINLPDFLTGDEFYEFKATRDASLLTETEIKNHEAGVSTDWIDLSLRGGSSESHNLSVSGGSDAASYYVGGDYLDVTGLSITDDYQRYAGRVNLDVKVTEWLDSGTRSQFTYDDRGGYDIYYEDVFQMNPLLANPYDENGEVNLYPWPEYPPDTNPLEAKNYKDQDYSYQLVSNNYLKINFPFIEGLSYRINAGIRRKWADRKTYGGNNTTLGIANSGYAYLSRTEVKNNVIENILSYDKKFDKHSVFITGVYSREENEQYFEELEAKDFPNDEFSYYGISQAASLETSNNYERTALISLMLRVNYSYNSKYLITLTGRRDGFSGFGPDNKWGIFPSVALGWNVSKEPWFSVSNTVNLLKLRLSWGINGNQAVDPYASITRLSERNTLSGNTSLIGYVPSVIGDENLGWESSETINLGIDFGLYNNRVFGDLNLYKTNTSDLLLNRTISSVHGISEIVQNIGETETKGLELSLSVIPVSTRDFNWTLSGSFAANKNEIVSLYGALDENGEEINDLANAWFIGKPIRINYGYKMIGVWQLDEAEEAAKWDAEPGYIKIEDVNGDGVLNDEDRQIIGQQDPKSTWGLSNSFAYKNFNLEIFLQGSYGATKLNNLLRDNVGAELRRNVLNKDWWTETNPTNKYFKNDEYASSMGGVSTRIYEDASYIRLKDISLSYNFPRSILSKLDVERLQLFVTGRNLATITDWTAGDPELELPSSEAGILPLQREFLLGINISF